VSEFVGGAREAESVRASHTRFTTRRYTLVATRTLADLTRAVFAISQPTRSGAEQDEG